MARKFDSGWRDTRLPLVHAAWGVPIPAAGMTFPTVEYDRGEAVAVINYLRRDAAPPSLADMTAYKALADLRGPMGTTLPFLTVRYDPRNWAMRLFGHNQQTRDLIGADGWVTVTELHFVRLLYRLRGRTVPLEVLDQIDLSTAPWQAQGAPLGESGWPGQDMSVRRRAYEPEGPGILFSDRNPCCDIDLSVIGRASGRVSLIVDYKLVGTYIDPSHKTHQAMSTLVDGVGNQIPSMIVRYDIDAEDGRWSFAVHCLNSSAKALLSAVTGRTPAEWTELNEPKWVSVLDAAQRL